MKPESYFHRSLDRKERRRLRRERILRSYDIAAQDPDFLRERDEIVRAFDATIADGLR
ncbi:MAG TPA: hypothetical protein VF746_01755 [Longimicrobium sp.]